MKPTGLTLKRKQGECIQIGRDIFIYFVETRRAHCQIVIDAPKDIPIVRDPHKPLIPPIPPFTPG